MFASWIRRLLQKNRFLPDRSRNTRDEAYRSFQRVLLLFILCSQRWKVSCSLQLREYPCISWMPKFRVLVSGPSYLAEKERHLA